MASVGLSAIGFGLLVAVAAGAAALAQQPPGNRPTGVDPRAPAAAAPPPRAPAGDGRAAAALAPAAQQLVTLQAVITDDGQPVDQGLIWRIYRDQKGLDEKSRLVGTFREAAPAVRLEPGDYVVHVGFGRANLMRKIKVVAGRAQAEKLVLNAGGLRLNAMLINGEPAPERSVSYDIYAGAKVTFKLVTEPGGNAIPDTQWSLVNQQGEVVKESVGAVPSHILAAGTYSVTARNAGKSFRRDFTVKAGDVAQVEVRMN